MSVRALQAVVANPPSVGPSKRLILWFLAWKVNDAEYGEGFNQCWPSVSSISAAVGINERNVRKNLQEMKAEGLISDGDPKYVAHYPAGKRPNVYRLNFISIDTPNRGVASDRSTHSRGVASDRSGVSLPTGVGVSPATPNKKNIQSDKKPTVTEAMSSPDASAPRGDLLPEYPRDNEDPLDALARQHAAAQAAKEHQELGDDAFRTFKAKYPPTARLFNDREVKRAWDNAIRDGATPQELIDGAEGYAQEVEGYEPRYVAQPQNFLSKRIWRDYQPAPGTRKAPPSELQAREECLDCDDNGWVLQSGHGSGHGQARKCDHPSLRGAGGLKRRESAA